MNLSIEERNQLVLENQKLIHYLLRPYRNKVSSPLYDYEDLVQVANEAMCLAIDKLDTQRSKFSTWISSYILGYVKYYRFKNACPYYVSRNDYYQQNLPKTISFDSPVTENDVKLIEAIPNDYDFVNESMLVAMVKDICSKNKQSGESAYKAWTMHYVEGYGFEDIARVFGVSKQAIFSKIKKIDNKLKVIYSHLD